MKYDINVSISIMPSRTDDGALPFSSSNLSYYRQYRVTGDNFSDIAPRIDAVHQAIELVADPPEDSGDGHQH